MTLLDFDWRILSFSIWGLGAVAVFGVHLARERRQYKLHHDSRAMRDLLTASGLFLTALASAISVWMVLFGQAGTGLRGLAVAVALGAFLGVGIVLVTTGRKRDPAEPRAS